MSGFVFLEPDAHLTPAEVERFLNLLNNEVARAQNNLSRARGRELDAKKIHARERDRLLLSDECPNVGRASGDVTVAERDAWMGHMRTAVDSLALPAAVRDAFLDYFENAATAMMNRGGPPF